MPFRSRFEASETLYQSFNSTPVSEFMLNENYGQARLESSLHPFVCGLTHHSFTALEQKTRTQRLARALAGRLKWRPGEGSELDKVVATYTYNTIDVMTLNWAVHMLNGVSAPASSSFTVDDLVHQLEDSGAKVLFTCAPLLQSACQAATKAGIPFNSIFVFDLPVPYAGEHAFTTLEQLVTEGATLAPVPALSWEEGRGARQTAFLCYSSGTSGLPKGVRISHQNIIANVLQITEAETPERKAQGQGFQDVLLGLLPQSHIYLIAIFQVAVYRGDSVVVLPRYNLDQLLTSVGNFRVRTLPLVPPIIIDLVGKVSLARKYDLSSVRKVITTAAPLAKDMAERLCQLYPAWRLCQAYGLTETSAASWTTEDDIWLGSAGGLLPNVKCRLLTDDGDEVQSENQPGELLISTPAMSLGYHNNQKATEESYVTRGGERWFKTGDIAMFRSSSRDRQSLWIVDRVKELIKVKGLQVAPAELEALLLTHPAVRDCAVIATPDQRAGELPKAFIVLSEGQHNGESVTEAIYRFVKSKQARHKWLEGGIEFVDTIPKNASGKILRRHLRDQEAAKRRASGSKL
ncbi:hypothetical protein LTR53_001199 [Teratosphaeriaceae sp. CCFEE 6253]|nr:hypothetical protein LTR53_001199 [Teratosphaeriaceae sp. CCFEE 6253]